MAFVAGCAKIDELDAERRLKRFKQNVFWFHVAVNDVGVAENLDGVEELRCEDAHQPRRNPSIGVLPDELVQVR